MKKIISIAAVCIFFTPNLFAQENPLLRQLLDLPAPPPVVQTEDETEDKHFHSEDFYDDKNVPPDDAPFEDVFDYWKRKSAGSYYGNDKPPKVSAKNAERLLDEFTAKPEKIIGFLKIFPDDPMIAEKIKYIFDSSQNAEFINDGWRNQVRDWLKYNSNFYIDELIGNAEKATDNSNRNSLVKNRQSLESLAKFAPEKAVPILQVLSENTEQPTTATLAKKLFYEIALKNENESEAEKYRAELIAIVEAGNFKSAARDVAFSALMSNSDWDGRDDWYFSLFNDESLVELLERAYYFRTLCDPLESEPERLIPKISKFLGGENRKLHNAIVGCLIFANDENPVREALLPLIPWLSNPDWADDMNSDRRILISKVSKIKLPEAFEGLIWILENDEDYLEEAAEALEEYRDNRAVPFLRNVLLKTSDESVRQTIISAVYEGGGFTDEELVKSLEIYASSYTTKQYKEFIDGYSGDEFPFPKEVSIGKFLNKKETDFTENFIILLLERIKVLRKTQPEIAKNLTEITAKWQNRILDLEMLRKIFDGEADTETIIGALARRSELKERVLNDLYAMRGKSGLSGALAACILEDENDILSAFHSRNTETSIGTLACARLLRKSLPVREVGALLDSNNKLLALAAERYLESEDSPEARNLVWAKHPGEALILGARDSFNPAKAGSSPMLSNLFASVNGDYNSYLHPENSHYADLDKFENKLRDEIKTNRDLVEIYSIYSSNVLRIYKDRAVLTWYEDDARYRERVLKKEELEDFRSFVAESKIENSPPVFGNCHHNCGMFEFIHLSINGGRRFFAYTNFLTFINFQMKFESLINSGNAKLRYNLQDKIEGLEIILADERYSPQVIWKNGDDFRVLVEDKVKEREIEESLDLENKADEKNEDLDWEEKAVRQFQRKTEREFEHYEWRDFSAGNIGEKTDEPIEFPFLQTKRAFPAIKELRNNENLMQTKFGNYEIRAGEYNTGGLWKTNRGERIEFKKGVYANPIVSGNYVVAAKADLDWSAPNSIVRINLQTNKESKINLPPAEEFNPVAFVPAHNKVLLYRDTEAESEKPAEYYLLDTATGKAELVKGEFRPLIQQTFRNLQPTGNKDEFWTAVYDREKNQTVIGRYDAKAFAIKSVLTVPEISLNSMQIWVDEKAAKVYFIYQANYFGESHLLSLPFNEKSR